VAQQYLPDSLQGKVFYQPSAQGYEAGVRERVARRREEQLAAVLSSDERPAEILTFTRPSGGRDLWLERAVSRASEELAAMRERVFAALDLARHHLVLDLNAGSGLLTWEALRRVPEGGVWARVRSEAQAALLAGAAQALGELERPHVLTAAAGLSELPALLGGHGTPAAFDALVGADALLHEPDKGAALSLLASLLAPRGRLSLAETVASRGSRLNELLRFGSEEELGRRVAEAEEAVYAGAPNALLNWSPEDLARLAEERGLQVRACEIQVGESLRRVRREDLERWFAAPDYGGVLRGPLGPEGLDRFKTLCLAQLADRELPWKRARLYLACRR
jgi:putative ATPase